MNNADQAVLFIIDGHNLLYALRPQFAAQLADGHPGGAAREALMEMLVAAFTGPRQAVRVYFDGGTAHAERRSEQVEVIYPGGKGDQRADKAILQVLDGRENDRSPVTVVTRDIKLARRARKRGATVMDPGVFFEAWLAP